MTVASSSFAHTVVAFTAIDKIVTIWNLWKAGSLSAEATLESIGTELRQFNAYAEKEVERMERENPSA